MSKEVVSDWGRLIREQFMSGESQRRYCRKRGVSLSSFQYQKSKRAHLERESPEFVRIAGGAIEEGRNKRLEASTFQVKRGDDGAEALTGRNPHHYLTDVLPRLASQKTTSLVGLTPLDWKNSG